MENMLRFQCLTSGHRDPVADKHHTGHHLLMQAVLISNDPVQLSFLAALLADAGIETTVLDTYTSITEGSAGAIPRRLMVGSQDYDRACRILREAGEL